MTRKKKQLELFIDPASYNAAIDKIIELSEVYDLFGQPLQEIKTKLKSIKK